MAISEKRRLEVQTAIEQWLTVTAGKASTQDFWAGFPDIPKPTFYRWVANVRDSGRPARKAIAESRKAARALAQADKEVATAAALAETRQHMPEAVAVEAINPVSNATVIQMVHECIGHARRALAHCVAEDGRIRNFKGFLQASNHQRVAIETLARVAERLADAQKIEQIHAAILEEITAADPATAARIVERLQRLRPAWSSERPDTRH
jgi:lipopolysaccharide biosynthesis regulator YciM